ncbi:MAG: hypothetical protein CMO01_13350 [Thalassobius sp.]|nr:hypothetical protein [Thalassovita sp.]|tara:strand:- start:158 stop:376 length:219 start_codon:yes stop_codon:yes gene_type:complete
MEIYILADYAEKQILCVTPSFDKLSKDLNQRLNKTGHPALIPGILKGELQNTSQVEIKAGKHLYAVTVRLLE